VSAPSRIPVAVRQFAIAHKLPLRLVRLADGSDYWYELGEDMTRTARPKACHALALCRRYVARHGGAA
jgi:hypothetical protein